MKRRIVMSVACLVTGLTAVTTAAVNRGGPRPSVERQPVAGARPEAPADGKRLYDANCANCHGARAQGAVKAGIELSIITERGGKQAPDLTDSAWDHGSTDAEMATVIKKGIPLGMMAPYEGRLSDGEIRNVIAYIRSLSGSQAPTAAPPTAAGPAVTPTAPAAGSPERALEVADYVELPITGDMSADRVSGVLARGSIMRDEPGGARFFVNDLNGPLYILNKQTKQLTPYLNFSPALFPKFTAAMGYAAGLMNFVFDPDYARNGIFYTLHMENLTTPGESATPKTGVVPGLNLGHFYSHYTINERSDGLVAMSMDGQITWKTDQDPPFVRGGSILADGLLLMTDGNTKLYLIEPNPTGFKPLASAVILTPGDNWAPLALADGTLFVRGQKALKALQVAR